MTWQITDNQLDFSISQSIAAPQELVYRVLADMEAYPEVISDLVSVRREANEYHFVARAAVLTIPARLAVVETPFRSIRFDLIEGPVEALQGSWQVEAGPAAGQANVTLTIRAETGPAGQWLLAMTAKFIESKSEKLVAAFSKRVVEMQQGRVQAEQPQSEAGFLAWFKRAWARFFGRSGRAPEQAQAAPARLHFSDEHQILTLEALAATLIPADDFDSGVQGSGLAGLVEMRARYEAGRAELYATGLRAVDQLARLRFKKADFVGLTPAERSELCQALRQDAVNGGVWGPIKPSAFFAALWEDTVFLYCTQPATWQRIGFPGPAHRNGGYPDFAQVQRFAGEKIEQ
jgi:ribosome-associated toxin RatA of RatAB toxin-antitoxin module